MVSAWPCSNRGLPGRGITANAGGLLHHLFTLTLAGGMSLWPDPAGSSEESPPRVLPGGSPCGERTFLEVRRLRDHLTSLNFHHTRK